MGDIGKYLVVRCATLVCLLLCINEDVMSKHIISNHIRNNDYPDLMKDKGLEINFRKACTHFSLVDLHTN